MSTAIWTPVGLSVQSLGLALMIGGMLALGAFTAPVLFKQFERPDAGEAMTLIFRRYDVVLTIAFALVVLGEVVRGVATGMSPQSMNLMTGFRYGALLFLAGCMAYSLGVINPKMEAMQKARQEGESIEFKEFETAHKTSEQLYKLELLLAVLILLSNPFLALSSKGS